MDNPGPSIILALILLLFLSAFFSASETALSSVSRLRLRSRAENGDKKARGVLRQLDDYDGMLSAILIGNNVVNLTASSLATILATALLGPVNGPLVATLLLTILVLIFGEILPKSLAKEDPERVSAAFCAPLNFIRVLMTPLVWLFAQLRKPFRRKEGPAQPAVTEDDLKTFIDTVEEEGVLSQQETDIIQSAIEFDDITVQEILIPRVDMVALDADAPTEEILSTCLSSNHSRIPVYEGSIDHIIGMLHSRDLLECLAAGRPVDLRGCCRKLPFVYRQKHINVLLAEFRRSKQQMAIVTDDYGGTLGLVTMEDILEELVGEIFDETDQVETPVLKIGEGLWRVDADLNIDDLFDALDLPRPDFEGDFSSAGGWALECLEHIPVPGESFTFENLHVTVQAVEDKRIVSLLVRMLPGEEKEED